MIMKFLFPLDPQSRARREEYPQLKDTFGKMYFRISVLFLFLFPAFGSLIYTGLSFLFSHFFLWGLLNAPPTQIKADLIVASIALGSILSNIVLHIFLRQRLGAEYFNLIVFDNLHDEIDGSRARKWIHFVVFLLAIFILLRGLFKIAG